MAPPTPTQHSLEAPGSSPTAEAFDATISAPEQGKSLFYVVTRGGTPDAAVLSVGGVIAARLATPNAALALAPLAAHAALRERPDIALAGPVTIDAERFQRFTSVIGGTAPRR